MSVSRMSKVGLKRAAILWATIVLFPAALLAQGEIPEEVNEIFEESCAFSGCHAGANAKANYDMTSGAVLAASVNVNSRMPGSVIIKPGDPENSYLIKKIRGDEGIKGGRMPRGEEPLTDEDVKVIADWIASMGSGSKEKPKREYAMAFPGWTSANLPTTQTVPKGGFMYRVAHRFNNAVDSGFDALFGLDGGAFMTTQVAFPLSNDFSLNLERSGANATFELGAKWRFLQQKNDGSTPISAAIYTGLDWQTASGLPDPANPEGPALDRTAGERFSFFAQAPVSKQFGDFSLLAVPGILLNGNVNADDEEALITLGLAGKIKFSSNYAFFVEAVPIIGGSDGAGTLGILGLNDAGTDQVFYDAFTGGVEIHVGGHVFQVFVSNSLGATSNQYMSGGNFDFANGDMRLGFNIYRTLNYPF